MKLGSDQYFRVRSVLSQKKMDRKAPDRPDATLISGLESNQGEHGSVLKIVPSFRR